MTNPSIASDLIERLRAATIETAGSPLQPGGRYTKKTYRNPDGPEAAEALSQLTREVGAYRGALRQIADDPYRHGHRAQKMKRIASEALSRTSGRVSDETE